VLYLEHKREEIDMKVVQNRFTELLARKGRKEGRSITRRKVAEETGIGLSSVQNWAANQVTRYDALQIAVFCEYLNCTPGELLILEEVPNDEGQQKTLLAAS
jgi:DNA-binding Xre family transcriptional regulator